MLIFGFAALHTIKGPKNCLKVMVYVSVLSEEVYKLLHKGISSSKDKGFRNRCHAILLSAKGFCSRDIAIVCDIKRKKNVCEWIKKFKEMGIEGLYSKPGRGRKSVLSSLTGA